ncbi:MAG: hypothetical protein ACRCZF_22870, partial [Gemmataceae bacterium]
MVPNQTAIVRRLTFALVLLAAVAFEIAAEDERPVWESVGLACGWIAPALIGSIFLKTRSTTSHRLPLWLSLLAVIVALGPLLVEPLRREWTGNGYPLEIQLVSGFRNLSLLFAAAATIPLALRLASVTSVFLILFAAAMSNHAGVMLAVGAYVVVGSIWLMLAYWSGLQNVFVTPEKTATLELAESRLPLPWLRGTSLVVLLAISLTVVIVGPRQASWVLGELMPTSGGTGATDIYARSGIGDGPEEMAGANAMAAGMVESDKVIEDNKNALIDAVNDSYGPPHKPNPNQERTVAAGKMD